ncbi:MAG: hypothetical protein ACT4PO_16530 [Actinomycetota bacterium]
MKEEPQGFAAQFVDLDLFAPTPVSYRVTLATGEERRFGIPQDLPFPLAAAFLRAYDTWARCQFDQLKARSDRARTAAAERYGKAWELLLEAFLPIVALREPEVTIEVIRDQVGHNAAASWVMAVANRMDPTRWLEVLGMLTKDAETEEASPKVSSD